MLAGEAGVAAVFGSTSNGSDRDMIGADMDGDEPDITALAGVRTTSMKMASGKAKPAKSAPSGVKFNFIMPLPL